MTDEYVEEFAAYAPPPETDPAIAHLESAVETDRAANFDPERAVLGAMLVSPDAVWTVQGILRPEDFAEPRHEILARVIVGLAVAGHAVDPITVTDALDRQGLARQAGGTAWVFALDGWSAPAVAHHAEIIRDRAVRRALRQVGREIHDLADAPGDAREVTERARSALDLATTRTARASAPIGREVSGYLDSLDRTTVQYASPWPILDELIGGFAPGRFYVIAARPGSGKTIMGVQIAAKLCENGAVAYSSLEMERREILGRVFADRASVDTRALENGNLTRFQWESVAKVRASIEALPLHVDDSSEAFVADVQAHARTVARSGHLAGIVVDYLGLLAIPADRRSRWEHFSEISHQLKRMAKTLRVPVIALQQLGRESEAGGKIRPPMLSDIRDSGSIEQDADAVLLLHRTKEEANVPPRLAVNLAKNRHGPVGDFHLGWHPEFARVNDYSISRLPIPPEALR